MKKRKWIGVDLDGTLAIDDTEGFVFDHIGPPVPAMLRRVQHWLNEGREVRIVTARVSHVWSPRDREFQHELIGSWCRKHVGCTLQVTSEKNGHMEVLWDDRAIQVVKNTGRRVGKVQR